MHFLLSGLGVNWALAIVETEREGYVLANFVEISDNFLTFLIGGSTNRTLSQKMCWRDYRLDNKGISKYKKNYSIFNKVIKFCNYAWQHRK